MKKFVVACVVSAVAFASPAVAAPLQGAYAGIGASLDNFQGSGALEGIGTNGVGGTLVAGYDLPLGQVFAGVEGNLDLNTADALGIDAKWGWGLSTRIGTMLSESTAVYGRVGYQRNKANTLESSHWFDGARFGAGVETVLSGNSSLRVEFNHVNYEKDLINNQAVVGVVFRF